MESTRDLNDLPEHFTVQDLADRHGFNATLTRDTLYSTSEGKRVVTAGTVVRAVAMRPFVERYSDKPSAKRASQFAFFRDGRWIVVDGADLDKVAA